jgi:coproporphyrinogen III oxidase
VVDLFEEDASQFHSFYKSICDKYSPTLYEESKAACDAYFYIPARKEHRGTGGIFFDDLESFQKSGDQMKVPPTN